MTYSKEKAYQEMLDNMARVEKEKQEKQRYQRELERRLEIISRNEDTYVGSKDYRPYTEISDCQLCLNVCHDDYYSIRISKDDAVKLIRDLQSLFGI